MGTYITNGGDEKCARKLVGKPERKGPLKRLNDIWEDNFEMDLKDIRFGSVDSIHEAQVGNQ